MPKPIGSARDRLRAQAAAVQRSKQEQTAPKQVQIGTASDRLRAQAAVVEQRKRAEAQTFQPQAPTQSTTTNNNAGALPGGNTGIAPRQSGSSFAGGGRSDYRTAGYSYKEIQNRLAETANALKAAEQSATAFLSKYGATAENADEKIAEWHRAAKNRNGTYEFSNENQYDSYLSDMEELQRLYDDYNAQLKEYELWQERNAAYGSDDSAFEMAGKTVRSGIGQFAQMTSSTASFLEGLVTKPLGALLGHDELYKDAPLYQLAQQVAAETEAAEMRRAESLAGRGKAAQIASELGVGTVAAIPQAILALVTGGASAAAQGGQIAQTGTGLASQIGTAVKTLAQNPSYWASMAQTLGPAYDSAKANGANELQAVATAFISSALNSGVEVAGGIETLPGKLRNGDVNSVMQWVLSAPEEGLEEVVQRFISGSVEKAIFDRDREVYSTTNPNAIINPKEMGKEFAMGTGVGLILGGAQTAAISGVNAAIESANRNRYAPVGGSAVVQPTAAAQTAPVVQDNEATMAPLRQAAIEMAEAEVKQRAAERTATVSKSLGYGKEGARVFGEIYNGGEVDAKTLLAVFDTPYQAGLTGGDGKQYTDPMQIAAYSAGNSDRIAQQGIDTKAKPGKVFSKTESGFDYTNAPADLTQQQKNFGNLMAKTFGIKGNFVKGETAYNARYVSNVGEVNFAKDFGIDQQLMQKLGDMDFQQKVEQLASKRQQSFAFYVAHEIADHVAANRAPVEMRAFNNAMYNYLRETEGANLARERMAFYGSRGANLDTKGAIEEVAADSILMLYDGDEQKFMTAMERVLNGTDERAKRGAKTWGEALKNIIEKLKAWARKLTGRDNAQAKADVEKSVAELERLRDMFEAAIAKAAQNVEMARTEGTKTSATANQDVAAQNSLKTGDEAATYEENGKQYSLKSLRHDITEGRMFDDLVTAKVFNQKEADLLKQNLDKLVSYMVPNANILDMNEAYGKENRPYSAYKPNSDPLYVISLDFSTLCRKRLMTQYVIEQLQLRENRPMSAEEQIAIRSMLLDYRRQENALQVACAMCYVEAARLKAPKQMERFFNDTEAIMRKYFAKKDKTFNDKVKAAQAKFKRDHGYDENATKKDMSGKDTKALNEMSARMRKEYTPDAKQQAIIDKAKSLPRSTFLTAGNLTALAIDHPDIYAAYTDHIRASTRSKSLESDIPYYYGDSEDMVSDSFIDSVNAENGMRFDSWSDFQMKHMLDMITAVIDLSVRGSKMHGYTKFPEMVRIFGKTGMMFNLSGVTEGNGFDENGDLLFSNTEGIDIVEARKLLRDFPETAGLQCIGVSDDHIRALLRADYVDYVIPYHTSGMNATLRKMAGINNWKDYTSTQHARKDPKAKKPADADKWQVEPVWSEFYVPDGEDGFDIMETTAQRYIDLCHERGLIPKFDQFMDEPGYWKLLVDRKMVNQKTGQIIEQQPVKPIFDFDLIKQEIDREVSQYDPQLEKRALKYVVDNFDAVHQRIKDLKKGHPKKPMLKMANELLQAYAEGSKAQYSMKDSEGNALTKEQAEYFKDSKVRDRNGNLKVMYHGTNADFTVFDKGKLSDGLGFFFTEDKREAGDYGTPKPFYLNISNPFDIFGDTPIDNFIGDAPKYVDGHFNYDAAVKGLIDAGYDGILSYSHGTEWYVAFSPEQIKSVANAKPTVDPDIRFSLKGEQQMAKELKRIRDEGKKAGKTAEQIRTEVARIVGPEYAELLKTYGAIERGETPFRDIQVPERTGKNRKVSQTVRTILEAEATPDAMIPDVEALVAEGALSFESYTDDQAIADATAKLQTKGWSNTLSKWISDVDKGVVTKENTVTGWALYNNAANKGDVETALTILQKMVGHQRNAAQALQATRVLKKLSPDAQLYGVQRSVQDLQDELNKKYGDDKAPQLKIDPELGEKFMQAETDAERDEVMGEIYRDVGKQMPSTFRDKWNAWRYLAMLGNARTHVRNIVGNAGFAPVVGVKNITATGIETLVNGVGGFVETVSGGKYGGKIDRTKAITADKAMLKAAWADYANVADEISNGGKYSDFQNANKQIEAGRVIFKNKALEKARTFNSAAMEKEDTWFSKPHYAAALASYCKANGITAQQIAKGGKAMDKARAYAIKEAQKATYRDTNALSQAFGEIGGKWRTSSNPVKKGVGIAIEGILPFRKTPANILARGVEYSPIGLMNGIKKAVWDVQKGNATAAEAIDNISAGLTGSMLMALGAFLAAQGLIRGGGEGDDKEKEFAKLQGHQNYAMELPNGKSVTLDWLAPEALPFFIGVNFFESTQGKKEETDIDSIIGSVTSITEPLLEMSCLQGLNDLIDSVGYASGRDVNALVAMAASAATSYLTQALPTLGGQLERSFQKERMTTYSDKNKRWIPADLQYTIGKATAKIPGLDYQQIPYIDAWGRTESTGNFAENAFGNLLNPSYTSQIDTTDMEDELLRLYRSTGKSVFPSRAARYFMVNNERKDLTAEEYVQYATLKGRYSYELLTELVDSSTYKSLTDAEKAKMVSEVFDNANAQAKSAISEYKLDEWAAKYAEAEKKYGIKQEVFAEVRMNTRFLASLKDKNGETITNSLSLLKMEAVYNIPGLTDKQRQALFDYLDVGKSVRHYNKSLVKQKLAEMRKNAK